LFFYAFFLSQRKKSFKKTVDAEECRRRRQEITLLIRKTKKDAQLAERRQMQDSGLSAPTPAGMAAASMLMTAGDNTYANIAMQQDSAGNVGSATAQSKLEQLAAMVQGVMGNDPAVQTIQNVVDAGVVPRFEPNENKPKVEANTNQQAKNTDDKPKQVTKQEEKEKDKNDTPVDTKSDQKTKPKVEADEHHL
jgi:hypothetical protein